MNQSELFSLLILLLTAAAQYFVRKQASTIGSVIRAPSPVSGLVNSNGYKLIVGRTEEVSKRIDDMSSRFTEFDRFRNDIRAELRESLNDLKSEIRKQIDEFTEVSRRRDDSWLIQFNEFRRQYKTDQENTNNRRSETYKAVEALQEQVTKLRQDLDKVSADVSALLETQGGITT